jgi:hypothetical protein
MRTPEVLVALGWLAGLSFVLLGCWSLHRRLRTPSSLCLLACVAGIPIWYFGSPVVAHFISKQVMSGGSSAAWDRILVATTMIVPTGLLLVASVSFWLSVRSVNARADESFKPRPVRGAT